MKANDGERLVRKPEKHIRHLVLNARDLPALLAFDLTFVTGSSVRNATGQIEEAGLQQMPRCLTASKARALVCMADAEFRIQVIKMKVNLKGNDSVTMVNDYAPTSSVENENVEQFYDDIKRALADSNS